MTPSEVDQIFIADKLLNLISDIKPEKDPDAKTLNHAAWMIMKVRSCEVKGDKAHRWLGYSTAILTINNITSIDHMRDLVREARSKAPNNQ